MRIQKISYSVRVGDTTHVISTSRVIGLKLRELVLVRAKRKSEESKKKV